MHQSSARVFYFGALALFVALAAWGETVVTRLDQPIDLHAPSAPDVDGVGIGEGLTKDTEPSTMHVIPYLLVDLNDANGDTTIFSLRHEGEGDSPAGDIVVGFRDVFRNTLDTLIYNLEADELQTVNPRVAADLGKGDGDGVVRGFIEILAYAPISVDYYQFDATNDFASGDNAASFPDDWCEYWKLRFLNGGPFDGGTELLIVVNGPRGNLLTDPPTVEGNAYREDGTFINSFLIHTNEWLIVRDSADLVDPGNAFGAIELRIDAEASEEGFVYTRQDAAGRYSVALNGVCKDDQFVVEE